MQFHFEKTLEKRYEPQVTVTNETPAWLMICLAESIKDWIGQSPRIFCKSEEPYLQFGYEVLTFPVAEFAQIFGPLIYAINQAWPVQVFGMGSQDELVGWLSGLTLQQKCELWRMFLGKRLFLPEFEWLRDAMLQGAVPNWIEWHLALYRVLEEENIRFFCKDGQFELLDKEGHRIYFGVDHSEAAEQVLMKVLFPLNQ